MTPPAPDWYSANYQYLMASVNRVYRDLEDYINLQQNPPAAAGLKTSPSPPLPPNVPIPFALDILCTQLGLSECERDILLMCVGIELDPDFYSLCRTATGNSSSSYLTLSLAFSALPHINFRVLGLQSPLQYWQLIDISGGTTLTQSPLRIDPCILCYLLGEPMADSQLVDRIKPVQFDLTGDLALPPTHQKIADNVASIWSQSSSSCPPPIVELYGFDLTTKRRIAAGASTLLGCSLRRMSAVMLPSTSTELHQLRRRWEREAILTNSILLLEGEDLNLADAIAISNIKQFIAEIATPLIVSSQQRLPIGERSLTSFEIPKLTPQEQQTLWQTYLGVSAQALNGEVPRLVTQFNLSQTAIKSVCSKALNHSCAELLTTLWHNCRTIARPCLDTLAQRIETQMSWDDLILPEAQLKTLREIVAHTRTRNTVYQQWGMGSANGRGMGLTALFYGQSGTGKTTAAEIIAKELHLDLYRIDLSAVVSKYIGETEKNLAQIFEAAEAGGVVLLFDEADSLFSKRGQVKEARDRYANQEVSYLLTRLETYQGLAILTTNLRDSIDQAFERRLQFVVEFPFPDAKQRELLWRRVFPASTPTQGLDFPKLGRLSVSGGSIRNIALGAAFVAAEASEVVQMKHLLTAAYTEGVKMQMTQVISAGTRDWVDG
ncbi:MAG TPA: ATPase [Cyanobacteria bacterium UBA8803]|nr:ATPase [Cyanobacteria bacterium UBA9273]HBL62077.1 ATPase [Cyanobacteria bacterium UBA8803]